MGNFVIQVKVYKLFADPVSGDLSPMKASGQFVKLWVSSTTVKWQMKGFGPTLWYN